MSNFGLVAFWVIGAPLALTACVATVIFAVEAMTNEARDLRHLHIERRRTLRSIRRATGTYPFILNNRRAYLADLDRRIADATHEASDA